MVVFLHRLRVVFIASDD